MLMNHKCLAIKTYENPIITPYNSSYETESLFLYGLNCMKESNDEIRNILSSIYKDSKYGCVEESVFREAFNDKFNLKDLIKTIFNLFIGMLKNIFNKFYLNQYSYFK